MAEGDAQCQCLVFTSNALGPASMKTYNMHPKQKRGNGDPDHWSASVISLSHPFRADKQLQSQDFGEG